MAIQAYVAICKLVVSTIHIIFAGHTKKGGVKMRAILIILALAFSSTATAKPTFGSGCEGCHSNTTGGTVSVTPSIDAGIGSTGNTVTFSLSGIPTGDNAALALFGTDAAGLDMSIGTPDDWFSESGYIYSVTFPDSTTSYDLTFDLGTLAALGTYTVDVKFAGGSRDWHDLASFDVNVVPSAIPVPAAAWLFGSGLLGLVGVARRRRNE